VPSPREAFLQALPPPLRASWETWDDLAAALARVERRATARWTALVDPARFAAYLGVRTDEAPTGGDAFCPHADELYLACAIVTGHKEGVLAFEQHYIPAVAAAVGRLRLSEDELDELKQTLRLQLLVPEIGRPPRIADYSGRGPLGAWVRVAAMRMALRRKRARDESAKEEDELERIASSGASPELRYAAAEHGAAFRVALRAAILALSAEDQNLLRQHHLDGLTLDQLSVLHRAHRTTIAYRIERARERLWKQTRLKLRSANRLSDSDCDSLFRHARSHLAITMRGLFD
jgi:RNA polymerase sigma-70 factor, ECF subfamily